MEETLVLSDSRPGHTHLFPLFTLLDPPPLPVFFFVDCLLALQDCLNNQRSLPGTFLQLQLKVARNEVENASLAQRSAHRDSRIWRPELIEPAAERKRRARGRRPTFKLAYPDPQILPQCNISSNYPPIMFGFSESADIGLSF